MPRVISVVEVLVQLALRKEGAEEAAKWFDALRKSGEKINSQYLATVSELGEAADISQYFFQTGQVATRTSKLTCVELMVKYVMKKCRGVEDAAVLFHQLHVRSPDMEQLQHMFASAGILEARTQSLSLFDEAIAARGGVCQGGFSKVGLIVRHILQACESIPEADDLFASLEKTIGRPMQYLGGGGFTVEQVREAWLRCAVCYSEQEALAQGRPQTGRGESSDSESEDLEVAQKYTRNSSRAVGRTVRVKATRPDRRRPGKVRGKNVGRVRGIRGDREAASGDDGASGEDLSGEEQVDECEEAIGGAALMADLGVSADSDEEKADNYPAHVWRSGPQTLPGTKGFNKRATAIMQRSCVGLRRKKSSDKNACPEAQPHQAVVSFLLHPKAPLTRLLVDHPTGSGKTREMILVLDNFFYDPRPKVPIFPKDSVCRNFYTELLRWPSRYRDYFCCERPKEAKMASGCADWRKRRHHMWDLAGCKQSEVRQLCLSFREVLEMKGMSYMGQMRRSFRKDFRKKHPGEPMPLAPLRAISYVSAGGSFAAIIGDQPASALMKVGYRQGCGNVYTNKVVLLDEAHNLVRTETRYAEQLRRLQDLLMCADDLILAGFTGTPILDRPDEGRQLLDTIKGKEPTECDEGFLSSFPARPRPIFPESLPRGVPDGILTTQRTRELVHRVELCGEALRAYEVKRRSGVPMQRLRNYCNVSVFHGSFHEGKNGCRARVLANPKDCCPKLWEVARAIASSSKKALVLTGRTSGYAVMLALMQQLAAKGKFGVATMDELAEFNHVSNLKGQKFRVLVADATQCSEGVNFLAVRRIFLTDVPASPSQLVQQVGRALRLYGHRGLPEKEQTVTSYLYVSSFPRWMRSSLSYWSMTAQKIPGSGHHMERVARRLASQLKRAGLTDLAKLKRAINNHAKGTTLLTSTTVTSFLEKQGLWEELQGLKHFEKRETDRIQQTAKQEKFMDEVLSTVKTAYVEAEAARPIARGRKAGWKATLTSRLQELRKNDVVYALLQDVAPTISCSLDASSMPSDAGAEAALRSELSALQTELVERKAQVASSASQGANPLVQALQNLHTGTGNGDDTLSRPETADEVSLRQLALRSREFAPALATLRAAAVDREIFAHLAEKLDEDCDDGDVNDLCEDEPAEDDVAMDGASASEDVEDGADDGSVAGDAASAEESDHEQMSEEEPVIHRGTPRLDKKTRMTIVFAMHGSGYPRLCQKTRQSKVLALHTKVLKRPAAPRNDERCVRKRPARA